MRVYTLAMVVVPPRKLTMVLAAAYLAAALVATPLASSPQMEYQQQKAVSVCKATTGFTVRTKDTGTSPERLQADKDRRFKVALHAYNMTTDPDQVAALQILCRFYELGGNDMVTGLADSVQAGNSPGAATASR